MHTISLASPLPCPAQMNTNSFLDRGVDLDHLAHVTKNFSGAEIEALVKSATAFALNRNVDFSDLHKPLDEENIKVGGGAVVEGRGRGSSDGRGNEGGAAVEVKGEARGTAVAGGSREAKGGSVSGGETRWAAFTPQPYATPHSHFPSQCHPRSRKPTSWLPWMR